MKRLFPLALALTILLTACGESQPSSSAPVGTAAPAASGEASSAAETPSPSPETVESTESTQVEPESQPEESSQSNILIAYFTLPEDVNTEGVDAISGASIIMRDGVKLGNCEFVAKTVQETIGGDLPMPVYTFLEEYDFTGKTIIPFVTHGGSGFSNTLGTIAALQPGATVSENTLSIARGDVVNCEETVVDWAKGLGLN